MKTKVILERKFMTGFVRQDSKNGMFNATDLVKIGDQKRIELGKDKFNLSQFLGTKSVLEFIEELHNSLPNEKIIVAKKGKGGGTWVHPLLFIDIALALDPKLKIGVYGWLHDELIKYRNDSGSSYNKMVGALYNRYENKSEFKNQIILLAKYIKLKCEVEDWNTATEDKLKLRDKIHDNISLLCDVLRDTKQAVKIGVENALKEYNKNKLQ